MLDFRFTDADERILKAISEERPIARSYARYYDEHEDEIPPLIFEEVRERISPYDLVDMEAGATSGTALMKAMVALEESCSDIRLRRLLNGLGSIVINYAGTEEQVARWGGKNIVFALTEPSAGSDAAAIRARAVLDEQSGVWTLNGEKVYVSGFGGADGVLVLAKVRDEQGRQAFGAFVLEKGTPGLRSNGQTRKMGIRHWDTEDIALVECKVPELHRIDVDFKKTLLVFNGTRPTAAAYGLGVAKALLDFARECLGLDQDERRFRKLAAERTATEESLLRMEALYDAALLTVMHSKWSEDRGEVQDAKLNGAAAKALGGMAARRISQGCMEILGAAALSEEHLAEKWFRDARIFDIFEGPGDINRLIIARVILGYSAKELN